MNSVRRKLMLGIVGYKAITEEVVQRSFDKCGLWRMDHRYVMKARKDLDQLSKDNESTSTSTRETDEEIYSHAMRFSWRRKMPRKVARDCWIISMKYVVPATSSTVEVQLHRNPFVRLEVLVARYYSVVYPASI